MASWQSGLMPEPAKLSFMGSNPIDALITWHQYITYIKSLASLLVFFIYTKQKSMKFPCDKKISINPKFEERLEKYSTYNHKWVQHITKELIQTFLSYKKIITSRHLESTKKAKEYRQQIENILEYKLNEYTLSQIQPLCQKIQDLPIS